MKFFVILFVVPTIYLLLTSPQRKDILVEFLGVTVVFLVALFMLKMPGCLKFVAIVLILLSLIGFYIFLIQPIFNGRVYDLGFI